MAELEAGFAKLQGEDFEYYMQTYSIVLGRNSKKSLVDVDLASLGGGMNISRQHARIYYDFDRKRFALEVLGKNGCYVEGVLYLKGSTHVKLDTQDLLQIGEKKFYFLLPTKKISKPAPPPPPPPPPPVLAAPPPLPAAPPKKRGSKAALAAAAGEDGGGGGGGRKKRRSNGGEAHHPPPQPAALAPPVAPPSSADEREVVAAVGSILSDVCGPGEWMPIAQLFSELQVPEHYSGNGCTQAKVWRFVGSDAASLNSSSNNSSITSNEQEDSSAPAIRPWAGLLALLRKHPEHFIINIKQKGRITAEYVSLVSLVS